MESKELIERYIYAVSKHLPVTIKKDVADELNSIIEDMMEERCEGRQATYQEVKEILTELGTPQELSLKYNDDRDKCLIGAPYYTTYKYILKIVCTCVAIGMPIASMLGSFASGEQWLPITIQMVASTASGLVSAFAYVTIIFAVLYHKEIKVNHYSDSIDKLPPVPKHAKVIPKRDPIKGIVTSVIFAIIFIGFPQVIFIMVEGNGVMIPVFNTDYIRSTWYLVAAFAMLGIVRECIKLMDGFYSKRLLITTIVINLLTGAISILWLSNDAIVNVDYLAAVARISAEEGLSSTGMIGGANDIFLVVILAVLILDTVVTVVKTFKND